MKKITRHVNDVDLNVVASLVNQLDSFKDDSGFGISLITIDGNSKIMLHPDLFFDKFSDFTVRELKYRECDYPYNVSVRVDGVVFNSLLSVSDIEAMKNTYPTQWNNIQLALQNSEGGEGNENQR